MRHTGQPFKLAELQDKLGPLTENDCLYGWSMIGKKSISLACCVCLESSGSKKDNDRWEDKKTNKGFPPQLQCKRGQIHLPGLLQGAGSWTDLGEHITDGQPAWHKDPKSLTHCCSSPGFSCWRQHLQPGQLWWLWARYVVHRPWEKACWSWWPKATPGGVRSLQSCKLQGSTHGRGLPSSHGCPWPLHP